MSKRALWATSTASPANERKRRTARSADGAPRTSPCAMPVRAVIAVGSGTPGLTSVSNVAPASSASTRWAPISTIRERAGERPVVSRSKTTNEACSSRRGGTGRVGEPDRGAAPREPRVARDDVVEQRAGDRRRGRREREERAGRLAGRHRPASRLDELDEAVGAVEGELHPPMLHEHMFDYQTQKRGPRRALSGVPRRRKSR